MQATLSSHWRRVATKVLHERKQRTEASTKISKAVLLNELKACSTLKKGKELHGKATASGSESCIYVATALLRMYSRFGSMVEARQVFDGIKNPDVVSWTALISGYAAIGEGSTALDMFAKMRREGCTPNAYTFVAAVKGCTSLAREEDGNRRASCLQLGERIHSEIGCDSDIYVGNALIEMYSKCGSMLRARQVFDGLNNPDVVSWTTLILGYAENGEGLTALDLFARMRIQPNSFTFVAALKACISVALKQDVGKRAECLEKGKRIHSLIGSHTDIHVQSALIDMYAKCASMDEAQMVFDGVKHPDVVSWNALMLGYVENAKGITALDLFAAMKSRGCRPNSITFVACCKACASLAQEQSGMRRAKWLERGRQIHSEIGCDLNSYLRSTLIDMYAKCGSMLEARLVFDSIQSPDVVSWNALILGYAENGEDVTALDLFAKMTSQGLVPDCFSFTAALKACTSLGALERGSQIHAGIGTELSPLLLSTLVDFYAKCGDMTEAQKAFDSHPTARGLITWTALLAGYSRVGDSESVFGLFQGMKDAGFQPDGVTFLCILTCCSHAGLLDKANEFFEAMSTRYGITPGLEHYTCMVDILGRSNKLEDAVAMLQRMPYEADAVTWMTVLGACRKWKNVEIGKMAFESLMSLDETNSAAYVLMGHIYGSRGMWEEQEMVMEKRGRFRAWKEPGKSCWTNSGGQVHTFFVGDNKAAC